MPYGNYKMAKPVSFAYKRTSSEPQFVDSNISSEDIRNQHLSRTINIEDVESIEKKKFVPEVPDDKELFEYHGVYLAFPKKEDFSNCVSFNVKNKSFWTRIKEFLGWRSHV